jgi:hypothetical protein
MAAIRVPFRPLSHQIKQREHREERILYVTATDRLHFCSEPRTRTIGPLPRHQTTRDVVRVVNLQANRDTALDTAMDLLLLRHHRRSISSFLQERASGLLLRLGRRPTRHGPNGTRPDGGHEASRTQAVVRPRRNKSLGGSTPSSAFATLEAQPQRQQLDFTQVRPSRRVAELRGSQ